jgi:hypothetical protein
MSREERISLQRLKIKKKHRETRRVPHSRFPSLLVVVVTETPVSMLVISHSAPTITAPVKSVTLPEIRAFSVCAQAAGTTSTGDFIEHHP